MVDHNKRYKLYEVGYVVRDTCGRCRHGNFPSSADVWGTCKQQTYQHQKHTDAQRHLSIHQSGWCRSFERSEIENLGGFTELREDLPRRQEPT